MWNTAQWMCDGAESGGRLKVHVRSRKAVFVSGPSSLEVDSLLDHYHMSPAPPSATPTHSLFLPHTSIVHPLLPRVSLPPLLPPL